VTLAELQSTFWHAARGDADRATLERVFAPKGGRSGADRFRTYNAAYYVRLERCLGEVFREVANRMGAESFRTMVRAYVKSHPSRAPAIEFAGSSFAEFLHDSSRAHRLLRDEAPQAPEAQVLADLARLEWARTMALLAPDAERAVSAKQVNPARLVAARLRLTPDVMRVQVGPRALALWPPTASLGIDSVRTVALYRRGFGVRHVVLDSDEAEALAMVADGQPLASACEAFVDDPDPVTRALGVVGAWFRRGWIGSMGDRDGHEEVS
jgi:hypothetical protein